MTGVQTCAFRSRVGSFDETFERTGVPALVQTNFDGLRCQIHKYSVEDFEQREYIWKKYLGKESSTLFDIGGGDVEVRLFTRNLEDVTEMFPEIVDFRTFPLTFHGVRTGSRRGIF